MADRPEIAAALAPLTAVAHRQMGSMELDIWTHELADTPVDVVTTVATLALRTLDHFPTLAEFLGLVHAEQERRRPPTRGPERVELSDQEAAEVRAMLTEARAALVRSGPTHASRGPTWGTNRRVEAGEPSPFGAPP